MVVVVVVVASVVVVAVVVVAVVVVVVVVGLAQGHCGSSPGNGKPKGTKPPQLRRNAIH